MATDQTNIKTPFIVTGLPRSRTAWFAAALTGDQSCCVHEPSVCHGSYEEFRGWLATPKPYHIGASDHALGFVADRLIRDLQCKVLIIERPFGEALASFERFMTGVPFDLMRAISFMEQLQRALDALKGPLVKRVPFHTLNDPAVVSRALRWVVPGIDLTGLDHAMQINIQVHRDHVLAQEAAKPHVAWYLAP